eukprot:8510964-Pyramimonas_sp.AAC.1
MNFYPHPEFKGPTDAAPADVAEGATWGMRWFWAVAKLAPAESRARDASRGSAVARFSVKELAVCWA